MRRTHTATLFIVLLVTGVSIGIEGCSCDTRMLTLPDDDAATERDDVDGSTGNIGGDAYPGDRDAATDPCANVGCGLAPMCGQPCESDCGCCDCVPGDAWCLADRSGRVVCDTANGCHMEVPCESDEVCVEGECLPAHDPDCRAVDPLAFGDCTTYVGVAFDGTSCVGVSGCGCEPDCDAFFDTAEACEAACGNLVNCPCADGSTTVTTPEEVISSPDAFIGNQVWLTGTVVAGRGVDMVCDQVECSELYPCCQPCGAAAKIDGMITLSGPNGVGGYTECNGNNCELTCTPPEGGHFCIEGTIREGDNDGLPRYYLDVDLSQTESYCEIQMCEPVPPSIETCCTGYAVVEGIGPEGSDRCGCICGPYRPHYPFGTLEACEAACGIGTDTNTDSVEYLGCSHDGAVSRIFLYRIDRTRSICTIVEIEENFGTSADPSSNCEPLGLVNEPWWCLSRASVSSDVAACEAQEFPGDTTQAIAVTGTFTIDTSGVDIDVDLEFPSGGTLPETVHFQTANCEPNCTTDGCRPSTNCTSLTPSHSGNNFIPQSATCPIDPSQPACASEDVGALVARSNDCLMQSCAAVGLSPWSHDFNTELVLLRDPFDGCEWPLVVYSVLDCGDHIEIEFSVIEPCETCDAPHPMWHVLHLPNDPKPVHATATLRQELECP